MSIKKRNKVSLEFSASSMTDLIFLLLIFFMLLSTMAKNNSVIDMNLPKRKTTQTVATPPVNVSLNKDMQYFIDNQPVSKEMIVSTLATKITDKTKTRVEISVDETIPQKYFVELVDLISVQGGYKISLQAFVPDSPK